ncbi:hypothetical protein GPA22_22180, partial [Aromatoleum toluvorans]|nr:hypothetical protein [Aromatoleum toluvorans]
TYAPRFLPTLGRPRAVALHFVRCDQLTVGLAPTGVRPCWAHKKSALPGGRADCISGHWRGGRRASVTAPPHPILTGGCLRPTGRSRPNRRRRAAGRNSCRNRCA